MWNWSHKFYSRECISLKTFLINWEWDAQWMNNDRHVNNQFQPFNIFSPFRWMLNVLYVYLTLFFFFGNQNLCNFWTVSIFEKRIKTDSIPPTYSTLFLINGTISDPTVRNILLDITFVSRFNAHDNFCDHFLNRNFHFSYQCQYFTSLYK